MNIQDRINDLREQRKQLFKKSDGNTKEILEKSNAITREIWSLQQIEKQQKAKYIVKH